ncbi:MAG: PEP-CTERM sorting domain-containing protein [Planctomycetota bacterium]
MEKLVARDGRRKQRLKALIWASGCSFAVAAGSPSAAAVIYPGPFVGSSVTYSNVIESSADPINDPEPLFGPPSIASGNLLDFDPGVNPFSADSPPADTTDGSLTFTVTSNNGDPIPGLFIYESGDFAMLGLPTGAEFVASILSVRVFDPSDDSEISPPSPLASVFIEVFDDPPFEGVFWENSVTVDLSGLGLTEVEIVLNNTLQAVGDLEQPVTTFIRKKDFKVDVIPEPSSAVLLALGIGAMVTRRRRG